MSLTPLYRGRAIWKRKARVARPERSQYPEGKVGLDAYKIAERNEKKFAQAYLSALGSLVDERRRSEFIRAWNSNSVVKVMQSLPFFADDPEPRSEAWSDFASRIKAAYVSVARDTSDAVADMLGKQFGRDVRFEYVEKQSTLHPSGRLMVQTIPVNPNALSWIDTRALELIDQGLSNQQREVVRQIIESGFERGLHSSTAFDAIKANIGLTDREYNALVNRENKMFEAGFQPEDIREEVGRYRNELLGVRAKRIARTETIFAESKGRQESWAAAEESGALPKVEREWISKAPSASPNNPCEICLSLDGVRAAIRGTYESAELDGPISGPPAHPNCTCTETIVEVE
jgi:hypothetical protein